MERKVRIYQLLHPGLEDLYLIVRDVADIRMAVLHCLGAAYLAVKPARKGIFYGEDFSGVQFPYRILEHEAQGADICPASVRVAVSDELHLVGDHGLELQFLQLVVHKCGKHGQLCPGLLVEYRAAYLLRQFRQGSPETDIMVLPVVFTEYLQVFHCVVLIQNMSGHAFPCRISPSGTGR